MQVAHAGKIDGAVGMAFAASTNNRVSASSTGQSPSKTDLALIQQNAHPISSAKSRTISTCPSPSSAEPSTPGIPASSPVSGRASTTSNRSARPSTSMPTRSSPQDDDHHAAYRPAGRAARRRGRAARPGGPAARCPVAHDKCLALADRNDAIGGDAHRFLHSLDRHTEAFVADAHRHDRVDDEGLRQHQLNCRSGAARPW